MRSKERKKVDQSIAKPKQRRVPGCRVDSPRSFLEVCNGAAASICRNSVLLVLGA
jgi:hypothetical protein